MLNENIFQIGKQATGESFIGRKELVADFRKNFLESNKQRTRSIVGLPRSGKSSFIKKVFDEKIIPVNYFFYYSDISAYSTYFSIWQSLFESLNEYLLASDLSKDQKNSRYLNNTLSKISDIINVSSEPDFNDNFAWNKFQTTVKAVFKLLKKIGIHSILVFDEFDHAITIFTLGTPQFALFRTIFSDADYDVSAITISRRKMETIEGKIYQSSTLANVMDFYPFKGFNDSDLNEYYSVLSERYNLSLSLEDKKLIHYYSGNLPYLLSVIGYNIVESSSNGEKISIPDIFYQKCTVINSYYQSCISQLETNGYLNKIIAFVIGPRINVDKHDAIELSSLGYLSVNSESYYICISDYFSSMLSSSLLKTSIWNELINLEKRLKSLVQHEAQHIAHHFQININDENQLQRQILVKSRVYSRDIERYDYFTKSSNDNYFGVMSLSCTVYLISVHWDKFFKKYFNNSNYTDYSHKFDKCADARNPIAHGHEDEALTDADKNEVSSYCCEFFDILSKTFPQKTKI